MVESEPTPESQHGEGDITADAGELDNGDDADSADSTSQQEMEDTVQIVFERVCVSQ